jgi:hypothetical protein
MHADLSRNDRVLRAGAIEQPLPKQVFDRSVSNALFPNVLQGTASLYRFADRECKRLIDFRQPLYARTHPSDCAGRRTGLKDNSILSQCFAQDCLCRPKSSSWDLINKRFPTLYPALTEAHFKRAATQFSNTSLKTPDRPSLIRGTLAMTAVAASDHPLSKRLVGDSGRSLGSGILALERESIKLSAHAPM